MFITIPAGMGKGTNRCYGLRIPRLLGMFSRQSPRRAMLKHALTLMRCSLTNGKDRVGGSGAGSTDVFSV